MRWKTWSGGRISWRVAVVRDYCLIWREVSVQGLSLIGKSACVEGNVVSMTF